MSTTYQIERRKRGAIGWVFLVLFWLFNGLMLISLLSGLSGVSSHYEALESDAARAGATLGATIGIGMILAIWAAGAVILGLLVLLTRGPKIIETIGVAEGSAANEGAPAPSPRKKNSFPWWGWAIGAVAALVLINALLGTGGPARSDYSAELPPASTTASAPTTQVQPSTPRNWVYDSERDEMRDATNRFATATSTNIVNMGFPYEDVRMRIVLRDHAQYGRDIMLSVTEGQFVCRYRGCTIAAKFDDGEIQTFSVNEAESGANDVLFIQNQSRFLANLRTAQRVVIEAQFFNRGSEQFTFAVSGLEWE